MEDQVIEPELTRTEKVKKFCKENWKPLIGLAGVGALKLTLSVLEVRRENKKMRAYIETEDTRKDNSLRAANAYIRAIEGPQTNDSSEDES